MSFILRKKKLRFSVSFEIEELLSVPYVSAVVYCKCRLVEGGTFADCTSREPVKNHTVHWGAKYRFQAKLFANATTGLLENCICKVSVRKEVKGGRSHEKLGFVNVNLAEFAGSGQTSRRFLLEAYTSHRRQDNSVLKVNLDMTIVEGDPMFKVPSSGVALSVGLDSQADTLSTKSSSAATLPIRMHSVAEEDVLGVVQVDRWNSQATADPVEVGVVGRVTLGRIGSHHSLQILDYSNKEALFVQSQASLGSSTPCAQPEDSSDSSGTESCPPDGVRVEEYCCRHDSFGQVTVQPLPIDTADEPTDSIMHRLRTTVVNNEDIVKRLLDKADLLLDESVETESSGLQLLVGNDGSAIVAGSRRNIQASTYHRVIVDKH